MGNVHVCNIGISSTHGKELPGQLSFHHEYKRSHIETNVRHICKIGVRTRWNLWSGNNWLGKSFMEVFVIDWWRKSCQSSAHKSLRLLRFCIVPLKDEREPPNKRCMGRQIGVVQKFTGIQRLGQNWRRANGIRVEYFPKIQCVAA